MLKKIGQKTKTGNSSPSVRILYSYCNRSGVWSNESGGSPWCSRKSRTARQNRAKFFAGKKQKRNFGLKFSTFFAGSFVVIRESRELEIEWSTWQIFRQKQPKKKTIFFISEILFKSSSLIEIFIVSAAEKLTFSGGGGVITSKLLASQWPFWGICKHAPPVFWRKRHLLYWKNGGQTKGLSWRGELVHIGLNWSLILCKRVAHSPWTSPIDDFLPPPIQTPLTESWQGDLVGNFLALGGWPLLACVLLFPWFVPRLLFTFICTFTL